MKLPERSKKYFRGEKHFPADFNDFPNACRRLEARCAHDKAKTIGSLAYHMERAVDDCDTYLGIVAEGVYVCQQKSREKG